MKIVKINNDSFVLYDGQLVGVSGKTFHDTLEDLLEGIDKGEVSKSPAFEKKYVLTTERVATFRSFEELHEQYPEFFI
jgi:hypothetical protein